MSFAPLKFSEDRDVPVLMRFVSWPLITATRLISDLRVSGTENLPATGPMIIAANHTGYLDPLMIGVGLYEEGIAPTFVAKKELFFTPLGQFLRGLGQMSVDREKPDGFLEAACAALDEGKAVVIFPEGTFTSDRYGWPMTPKSGVARLAALRPDVPVIPAAHWGSERLIHPMSAEFNLRRILHRSERVYVHFGPPVEMRGKSARERATHLMYVIGTDVARLRRKLGRDAGPMPTTLAEWAKLPNTRKPFGKRALGGARTFVGILLGRR